MNGGMKVGLSHEEYLLTKGLSASGMKDMAVSPLRYWFCNVYPDRKPEEPSPQMVLGTALHSAVLQPLELAQRHARALDPASIDGLLVTIEDLRRWLRTSGETPRGTRKDEVIKQVHSVDPTVPILEVLERQHAEENAGKTFLSIEDWARVENMAEALISEPKLAAILADGEAEVSLFCTDQETGAPLKSRLDFRGPKHIVDLKTFTCRKGKSIDRTVADAIWHEQYYRQAYFYCMLDRIVTGKRREFIFAFVESDEPYEVRLKGIGPNSEGSVNLYWERARHEVRGFINIYADYMNRFGESPWRFEQEITALSDEDVPQAGYAL